MEDEGDISVTTGVPALNGVSYRLVLAPSVLYRDIEKLSIVENFRGFAVNE